MPARIDYQIPATELSQQNNIIIGLHAAGLPSRATAKTIGTLSYRTVCRRLKQLTPRQATETYKELRADIFAEQQRKLLSLCHGKPAKEQLSLITATAILYDKERLERDKSTANVTMLTADIAVLKGIGSHK